MFNRNRFGSAIALIVPPLSVGAAGVMAGGPVFPLQLRDDRAGTLRSTPANSFAFEAAHLVQAADRLKANEPGAGADTDGTRQDDGMTVAQSAKLKAMRALDDGDAAYALGEGVPPAVRLYTAGA